MSLGHRQLFVYYRIDDARVPAASAALLPAQRALCARHAGLTARLLRRPPVEGEAQATLMETYTVDARADAEGVTPALQADIDAAMALALQPVAGEVARHAEVFIDIPSPGGPPSRDTVA